MGNEQTPEQWREIEKVVLSGIINGQSEPQDPAIFTERPEHRLLAKTALDLHTAGKPVDFESILANVDRLNIDLHYVLEMAGSYTQFLDYSREIEALYERKRAKNFDNAVKQANRMRYDGKPEFEIADFMAKTMADITTIGDPTTEDNPANFIENLVKTALDTPATDGVLGFAFDGFPLFTEKTAGLQQGLYLIGAETNIGKTTMLAALAATVMTAMPVVIFSLDDSKEDFAFRLLSQLSGEAINTIKASKNCSRRERERIEKAGITLATAALDHRFAIYDTTDIVGQGTGTDFDRLKKKITSVAMKTADNTLKPRLALCIDGLHNLDTGSQTENKRTENIDRAQIVKTLADTLNLAVICTVETRKKEPDNKGNIRETNLHDIMESGKYAYNANVALILNAVKDDETLIKCSFAKNKRSPYKGNAYFRFEDESKARLKECTRQEQEEIERAMKSKEESIIPATTTKEQPAKTTKPRIIKPTLNI